MFGPHGFAPLIMLSDSVDYREMTTGKRTEGIQYSVLSLSIKLANAFSVAVGVFIAAYWFIPGLCTALSMIPMLFYKLDRKEVKQQIKDFIAKRDGEVVAK